jgi:hypothetical protein
MSTEDNIISSVIFERNHYARSANNGLLEARQINKYGRKMIRMVEAKRISASDSDEKIAAALSSGVLMWLFWQIAPELLLWIVGAIRRRIWSSHQ